MSVNGVSNRANPAYTNFPAPESAGQNAPNRPSGGTKFPVPPHVEVKTVKGEDPRELHRRNLLEAASEAGLDGTPQQTEFVEKYLKSGIRFADAEQDTSPDDDLNLKSKDLKGDWQTYELSRGEIADLKRLQSEYTALGNQLKRGKTYENAADGEISTLARRGGNRRAGSDAAYEQRKMRDLWEKAQIPESSIFGTPSKLKDLKHVSINAPADGRQVDAERALRLYVRERYGDRLLADSRDVLMTIAGHRGVKVENLESKNGKVEFDISVENLLKLHHAYIGVQAKVNAELDAAQKTIDGLAHNRFAKGVIEGAWAQLKENWEMVSSPIETVKGIYEAAKTVGDIGLKLAQLKPEDRAKLFSDLAKAGVKGLTEMPVSDAAEHVGRFVGRIAVEAALGKGIVTAVKVLSASKYGAELLQQVVKISKDVKQTVGKIPIPTNASVKVLTDTLGNKMMFPDVEFTKLSDLVNLMKSSGDGLTMLKNGTAAGTKVLKETAESGLSEVAQSGLKALRGTLSKEGLAKAKEQLITLSVARTELLARLEKLVSNSNFLQDTKTALSKARNSIKDHLTQDDLIGALRDKAGKEVRQSGSGYTFNHLGEVEDSLNSLNSLTRKLTKELQKTTKGTPEFSETSKHLDAVKEMTRRIEGFLDIK